MIITQQFVKKVDCIITDESLIVGIDESMPALLWKATKNIIVLRIKLDVVLVEIVEQVFRAEDLRNLHQLIAVAIAVKEWLLSKDHACKHRAKTPHIEAVVMLLEIYQKLRTLEISAGDANIVFGASMVEFCKTPVNES